MGYSSYIPGQSFTLTEADNTSILGDDVKIDNFPRGRIRNEELTNVLVVVGRIPAGRCPGRSR